MTRRTGTLPPSYFDGLYAADKDPWRFRSSDYETEKYTRTLAALSRPRYQNVLEVGCSIGVFTARLAPLCDSLLAIDGSDTALTAARVACAASPHVRFENRIVPQGFPTGRFDLIVLSEVLYYLAPTDLLATAAHCVAAQEGGAEIILCHWLGETDYPLTGDDAGARFVTAAVAHGYSHATLHEEVYRLDRLARI